MPGMIADKVSHGLPFFACSLMHCIYLICASLSHQARKKVVGLVRIKFLWSAHLIPEILDVLLHARRMMFPELVRVVHVRIWQML